MGGPEHIMLNWPVYLDCFNKQEFEGLRVDTLCGKNLKFTDGASRCRKHVGWVMSICIDCKTQYEPDKDAEDYIAPTKFPSSDDLPF